MNMLHAESTNWFDYMPGFLPDNVKSVTMSSPTSLSFTFTEAVDPTWLTYNEFAQITPSRRPGTSRPPALRELRWLLDRRVRCRVDRRGVRQGVDLPDGAGGEPAEYASNPIWAIVDGPYTIAASKGGSFSTSGQVTLVPNTSYSGPQKPTVTVSSCRTRLTTQNSTPWSVVGSTTATCRSRTSPAHHERNTRRPNNSRLVELLPLAMDPLRLQLRRPEVRVDG